MFQSTRIPGGVFITKYALTEGEVRYYPVASWDIVVPDNAAPDYLARKIDEHSTILGVMCQGNYYHYGDWHLTEHEAKAKVEKMILSKRKSALKVLDKLDGYVHKVVDKGY